MNIVEAPQDHLNFDFSSITKIYFFKHTVLSINLFDIFVNAELSKMELEINFEI